jgi:hypothetical protein
MTLDEVDDKVEEYVLADRQWLRGQRVAHVNYQLKKLVHLNHREPEKVFWKEVLKRLT